MTRVNTQDSNDNTPVTYSSMKCKSIESITLQAVAVLLRAEPGMYVSIKVGNYFGFGMVHNRFVDAQALKHVAERL